jgi:hypothetical protein
MAAGTSQSMALPSMQPNTNMFMSGYSAPSQPTNRQSLKLNLKPQERGFFSNMFELANKSKGVNVAGVDAV